MLKCKTHYNVLAMSSHSSHIDSFSMVKNQPTSVIHGKGLFYKYNPW